MPAVRGRPEQMLRIEGRILAICRFLGTLQHWARPALLGLRLNPLAPRPPTGRWWMPIHLCAVQMPLLQLTTISYDLCKQRGNQIAALVNCARRGSALTTNAPDVNNCFCLCHCAALEFLLTVVNYSILVNNITFCYIYRWNFVTKDKKMFFQLLQFSTCGLSFN